MNFRLARAPVAAVAIAMAAASVGVASDGTITFTGAVTGNSCSISVNGTGASDGTVALPVVDTKALGHASAPQDLAAGTFFSIELSACTLDRPDVSGHAPTRVALYFEAGPTVDPATHGLINAGTSNVEVKLYEASGATTVGPQIKPGTAAASGALSGTGTWYFYAGYSLAAGATARAGTVNTTVTYSLVYL